MLSLVILTIVFIIVIILVLLLSKDTGKKVFLSLAFIFISIVLFFISFIVGGWDGMGLGAVSVSLFVASLIVIALLYKNSHKNQHQY